MEAKIRVVTDDGGDKMDEFAFRAPEFGGEMVYASNPDHEAIVVYRDPPDGKGHAQPVARLELPPDSPYRYIYSFEPIDGLRGSDTTYFSLIANVNNSPPRGNPGDCSIWILGLGKDPDNRFARRLDDGAVTGESAVRFEPESWVGESELFVYYNADRQLRLARTGLGADGKPLASSDNTSGKRASTKLDSNPVSAQELLLPANGGGVSE